MKPSNDSNAAIWEGYSRSRIDLWDKNLINDEYVIAYKFNPSLHPKIKNMLPKVNFIFRQLICSQNHKFRQWLKLRKTPV